MRLIEICDRLTVSSATLVALKREDKRILVEYSFSHNGSDWVGFETEQEAIIAYNNALAQWKDASIYTKQADSIQQKVATLAEHILTPTTDWPEVGSR